MIRVGIVGATGYTGIELLRLLAQRRDVSQLQQCDVVFFATPHAVAMHSVQPLLDAGVKVIDLSADFRIQDVALWEQWYNIKHACPELIPHAVYGLPEVNREQIKTANFIAVPGCYPTAIQLGFLPLLENDLVDSSRLIADAKSGVSGAGRKAVEDYLLCEATESIKAYGVTAHRHQPEICQGLHRAAGKKGLYKYPDPKLLVGSNFCDIGFAYDKSASRLVLMSSSDNLIKGAAGQAIQNMNVMFGLEETAGLEGIALLP